jgi:O-methyltransferase
MPYEARKSITSSGGILIVDDYGHYKGQQLAVNEYFATGREPILLNRIDYGCRLGVKR